MLMQADHDYHLHTFLSRCSADPEQTVASLAAYGKANGLRHLCITDHFWDALVSGASDWYTGQDLEHIRQSLPFLEDQGIAISFGCEAEMDQALRFGVAPCHYDCFAFINVALTHMHMGGFTRPQDLNGARERADCLLSRLNALFEMALPFEKIGLAHLTTHHLGQGVAGGHLAVLDHISFKEWCALMERAAGLGCGIELNIRAVTDDPVILRPYLAAKACGCKFFLGSDAHHPSALTQAPEVFRGMIYLLDLREADRYRFPGAKA